MSLKDNPKIERGTVYILRSLANDSWIKVKKYDYSNDDIGASPNEQGLPITGLTEDTFKLDSKGQKVQVKGTRVRLEEQMGLEAGTLSRGSKIKPNPFWLDFKVRTEPGDTILKTETAEEEMEAIFLAAQPQVAFGVKNITSKSDYVIFTRDEEKAEENKRNSNRRKAIAAFESLTLDDRVEVLEITGTKSRSLSASAVEAKLGMWAEDNPEKFLAIISDPVRKQKTYIHQCLNVGILKQEGGVISFGETVLGVSVATAAKKLFTEDMRPIREAMQANIQAANKVK